MKKQHCPIALRNVINKRDPVLKGSVPPVGGCNTE